MVRDDRTNPRDAQSLDMLLAGAAGGLAPDRVVRWAGQIARQLDELHESGARHGAVGTGSILIDDQDRAHLAAAPSERELLLGGPGGPGGPEPDDVRGFAAAIYSALGGDPRRPAPLPGVSVQVNLALLSALGPSASGRPATAGALLGMLEGAPVPSVAAPAHRDHRNVVRAAVSTLAAGAMLVGAWLWFRPPRADAPAAAVTSLEQAPLASSPAPQAGIRGELRAVEQQIRDAGAERALREARHEWLEAQSAAPAAWLDEPAVQLACTEADAAARAAREAADAGHLDEAAVAWAAAAEQMAAAVVLHEERVAALLMAARAARAEGRFDEALAALDRLETVLPPEAVRDDRIEAYTAQARRATRSTREAALAAVERLLELAPAHREAPALRAAVASLWEARPGDTEVNSLSLTLVYLGPGRFDMGSPRSELYHQPAERIHPVTIERGFWIGRVEVTRGQFGEFVADTGYETDAEMQGWVLGFTRDGRWTRVNGLSWRDPGFGQSPNHPVVAVSWHDAAAFCRWLSGREGHVYRLPTEAEWEYACRAGSGEPFAWGPSPYEQTARGNTADAAWMTRHPDAAGFHWSDGYVWTSPVASFPANGWGLFDMHGNVQEWCADVYAPYGTDTVDTDDAPRVLRGGSFAAPPAHCRAAHRDAARPDARLVTAGFRVVREGE